jgi:hypothetical protein
MALPPYQNFMKICQAIQTLLVGGGGHRQTGVLISLLSFLESSTLGWYSLPN